MKNNDFDLNNKIWEDEPAGKPVRPSAKDYYNGAPDLEEYEDENPSARSYSDDDYYESDEENLSGYMEELEDDYAEEYDPEKSGARTYRTDADYRAEIKRHKDAEEEMRRQLRNRKKKKAARRRKKHIQNLIKAWIIFAILLIAAIIGLSKLWQIKHRGTPLDSASIFKTDISFAVDDTGIHDRIEANYLAYLNRAYILFGEYPNCEYIKIYDNVARNDYDWTNDFYVGQGQLYKNYYKDGQKKGRVAIDVSEFQGDIDWTAVAGTEIEAAFVRLGYRGYGEGTLALDAKYVDNIDGAAAAGLSTGVYFYTEAVNYDEGVEEANFVLENIKGHTVTEPIVIDSEYMAGVEARANVISMDDRTQAIKGFCDTITAAGYKVMLYANRDWLIRSVNLGEIPEVPIWLAYYGTDPSFPYHVEAFQYIDKGFVDGINSSQVDLDVLMY